MITLLIINPLSNNLVIAEEPVADAASSVTDDDADNQGTGGLMLSPAEMEAIGVPTIRKGLAPGEWRLDGIIYHTDEEWTIWLNTDMYTPNHHPDGVTIISVNPGQVQLKKTSQTDAKSMTLGLNQCVRL